MLKVVRLMSVALAVAACAIHSTVQARQDTPNPFRIVGYYSLRAAMAADPAGVPFDKLTHINLSFLNPDGLGQFPQDLSPLAGFIEAAHGHGVKVLASIGGGGRHPYYRDLLADGQRAAFVHRLTALAVAHRLDGIDVDLEGGDIDANYEPFVIELAAALRREGKLITSAIAVFYKDALTDRALAQYDFVNIMSYDHTGPWRPEKPGPHAPYAEADAALDYFGTERNISRDKLVLGVPFYGYGFGPEPTSPAVTMTFADIAARFPGSEQVDEWTLPDGKIIYYNGLPTIRRKTMLARTKASGIMIWQILGDAPGDSSLLAAINDVATGRSR